MKDKNDIKYFNSIDKKQFELIYKRYWEKVLAYAISIVHDQSLAEDILQHVFISLWDKRNERCIEDIEAYLKSAVKYSAFHEIRKRLKMNANTNLNEIDLLSDRESDSAIIYKDLYQLVEYIIDKLPTKSREMFQLKFWDGLENKDIAKVLGLSEKTIRNKLSICMKSVRSKLRKVEF